MAGFFIVLGLVILNTPDILHISNAFFKDLTPTSYPLGGSSNINLPAPANPAAQVGFFTAVMDFMIGIGILQIIILPIRLWVKSPVRRIGETVGNLIFWLGGAFMADIFLLAGTLNGWFSFWTGLILLVGISLIVRFTIHFAARPSHSRKGN